MKFVTPKSVSEIKLDGITADWEYADGAMKSVTLKDAKGSILKFYTKSSYESLGVGVPAPPAKADKWRVSGKFAGVAEVCDDFDNEYEADDKLREYENKVSDCGLTVSKVQVEVPE